VTFWGWQRRGRDSGVGSGAAGEGAGQASVPARRTRRRQRIALVLVFCPLLIASLAFGALRSPVNAAAAWCSRYATWTTLIPWFDFGRGRGGASPGAQRPRRLLPLDVQRLELATLRSAPN
jgi:hypothetical protein